VKRALTWLSITIVMHVVVAVTRSSSAKVKEKASSSDFYSPTIAIIHLTKIKMPITIVTTPFTMKNPGMDISIMAERSKAIGNEIMNGIVAIVSETASLEIIAFTRVSIHTA
jgi:hypothetical protein